MTWKYEVIDNFFSEEDFAYLLKKLNSINTVNLKPTDMIYLGNRFYLEGNEETNGLDSGMLSALAGKYGFKLLEILRRLAPKKIDLLDFIEFSLVVAGPEYSHHVHDDDTNKLVSAVIYVAPEDNRGTLIHTKKNGPPVQEITWKPNRAFIFSRREQETWHSYCGDGISTRKTVIINFRSLKSDTAYRRKVLAAEGNYFRYYIVRERIIDKTYRFIKNIYNGILNVKKN
jgi:hypothetical protein